MLDVIVIGAGPAGVVAAMRAADLGAKVALVTRDQFGGMAANDGPVPVRTLAHAARLMREARQLGQYGIGVGDPKLDYRRLLGRVGEVVEQVREHSAWRGQLESLGVAVYERAGSARFTGSDAIETESGLSLKAGKFILCTGGASRRLSVPGFELTATHSDAWSLSAVPKTLIVVGAGATGMQVASIFNAFGTKVSLYQAGPRILPGEDDEVSAAMAEAYRAAGIEVRENFGTIEAFEKAAQGTRMVFAKDGIRRLAEAELVVLAVGWVANTAGLRLEVPGVELDERGFVRVDRFRRTSVPHIYAAGDVTGRMMLVPQAIQDGFAAASHAVRDQSVALEFAVNPIGSFTDPEYAQVGLTEVQARKNHDVLTVRLNFDSTTRTIIDGRTGGFCKLIVDRGSGQILGCHVVGERAVDIVQIAAVAMAAKLPAQDLARIPLSFPTYAGIFGRLAANAARQMGATENFVIS